MAETLVLAGVGVDTTGITVPVREAGAAVLGLGDAFVPAGQKAAQATGFFTALFGRMTSLRLAALTLGRALGLAGILATLTFAVVGLVRELITSTDWFQRAKGAVTDWWQALVHGEDALGRVTRHMGDFQKAAGFPSTLETIDQLKQLEEQYQKTFGERAKTMRGGAIFLALTVDLDNLSKKANQVIKDLIKLGFGSEELIAMTGAIRRPTKPVPGPTSFETFGIPTPDKIRETIALARAAQREFIAIGIKEPLFPLDKALQSINDKLLSIGLKQADIERLGLSFVKVTPKVMLFEEQVKSASETFTAAGFAANALQLAMETMGAALATALIEGGKSFRQTMAEMMKSIATMAFVYSLWNLALGIMALTPWGAAFLGPAAGYFKAAAVFGSVGIAAAAASRALGGGGAAHGAGAGAAAGAAAGGGGGVRTVNITFSGPVLGMNESALARYINDLQRRGERENA